MIHESQRPTAQNVTSSSAELAGVQVCFAKGFLDTGCER